MATFKLGKTIIRSLFKKPATLMYPVIPREWQERTRGHIENDINECIFCSICQKKCPTNALVVDKVNRTWVIERMKCIQCSCCVEVCPKKCLSNENTYTSPNTEKVIDTYTATTPPPAPKKPAVEKPEEKAV